MSVVPVLCSFSKKRKTTQMSLWIKDKKKLVYWTAHSLNACNSETLRLRGKKRVGFSWERKLQLLQWKNRTKWCCTVALTLTWETHKMPVVYKRDWERTHWEGECAAEHSILQASNCLIALSWKQSKASSVIRCLTVCKDGLLCTTLAPSPRELSQMLYIHEGQHRRQ